MPGLKCPVVREHCPQRLGKRLSWHGDKGLDWYLAMRSQGAAPTGGFGLGFDRLVQYLVSFLIYVLIEF